jgi:hypothetical protein
VICFIVEGGEMSSKRKEILQERLTKNGGKVAMAVADSTHIVSSLPKSETRKKLEFSAEDTRLVLTEVWLTQSLKAKQLFPCQNFLQVEAEEAQQAKEQDESRQAKEHAVASAAAADQADVDSGDEAAEIAASNFRPQVWDCESDGDVFCDVGDKENAARLMEEYGFVCFRRVAATDDLRRGEDLYWEWLETVRPGVKRDDPSTHLTETWKELGYGSGGMMLKESIGQSPFMWHCRLLPKVRNAYATLWGLPQQQVDSQDLITSFDGCGSWRNAWLEGADKHYQTMNNWFHLDQVREP